MQKEELLEILRTLSGVKANDILKIMVAFEELLIVNSLDDKSIELPEIGTIKFKVVEDNGVKVKIESDTIWSDDFIYNVGMMIDAKKGKINYSQVPFIQKLVKNMNNRLMEKNNK